MALYEIKRNAVNTITLPDEMTESAIFGPNAVVQKLVNDLAELQTKTGRTSVVAFDGWYGIPWSTLIEKIQIALKEKGITASFWGSHDLYDTPENLRVVKHAYITDDPGFGYVNDHGELNELFRPGALKQIQETLAQKRTEENGLVVLYGPGSLPPELDAFVDAVWYFDKTRQPLLWEMWEGKLIPYGSELPDASYDWKEYYYCDFYLLERQKHRLLPKMKAWVEAITWDQMKLLPRSLYDSVCQTLLQQPIKEVNIIQPGPWGAYRYRDWLDVPELGCNAWHELAGPELSVLINIGKGDPINFPFMNLMQYPEKLVGPQIAADYPGLFPMDVWLDDGYFPEKTPAERTSMPIHNHPSTDYVKRNFNEPVGRYETYYIAEAYEGANTWHGFKDGVDLEKWETLCRDSENLVPINDWKDYIANWSTNVGDLFLIPPGTTHCHGGNQMVLEMDTCPSIAGTEYSFFMYDFARNSWDESTKTMTAPPCKMHMNRGFEIDKWVQADYSQKHLQPRPRVVRWTQEYQMDRYDSDPRMPFEIERFHFEKRAENDTQNHFTNIITLSVGKRVLIRSLQCPEKAVEIWKFQTAVVPACFGAYEIINLEEGLCTVVQLRWKT